jgi:hypothetical protein
MPEPKPTLSPEAEAFIRQWGQSVPYGLRQLVRRDLAALLATARQAARVEAADRLETAGEKLLSDAPDSYTQTYTACLFKSIADILRDPATGVDHDRTE